MATYTITTANWNDPSFWASINESSAGHTLDFSALPSNFTVFTNLSGVITITDGATGFTIGEAGVGGQDANFGGSTQLDFFTTLIGAQGDDNLTGTGASDTIVGDGGHDSIDGSAGNDNITGGDGNDTITGGSGADTVDGGAGGDRIIIGGNYSTNGDEFVDGGTGNDTLVLAPSDNRDLNVHMGETGSGAVGDGQAGGQSFSNFENVETAGGNDTITGNSSDNILNSGAGNDLVSGGAGNDDILGGNGQDTLQGGAADDTISGGADNDTIVGGTGSDSIEGGTGNDTIYGDTRTDVDTGNLIAGGTFTNPDDEAQWFFDNGAFRTNDEANFTAPGHNIRQTIETVAGEDYTLTFDVGKLGANTQELTLWIVDPSNSNRMQTYTFDITTAETISVTFTAPLDSVQLRFEETTATDFSNHRITIDNVEVVYAAPAAVLANDSIDGGDGVDVIYGEGGNDTIDGGNSTDYIYGGDGADVITDTGGATSDDFIDGGAGNDTISGGDREDTIHGGSGNDSIAGDAGADTIFAGAGHDTIDGGADNDLLLGDLAGVELNRTGTDGVGLASNITDFPTTQITYEITLQSTDTVGDTSLGSYAVAGQDNEFSLQLQAGTIAVYVGGAFTNTGIPAASLLNGDVNTLAASWDSATGALEVYINGASLYSGTTATGSTLDQGGTFALGQDQDTVGGGFDTGQAFEGTIYGVRLYDDIRTAGEIRGSTQNPFSDTSDLNLIANWVADPNAATFTDTTGSHVMTMSGDVSATWSSGNDRLLGGDGADTIYGGAGNDDIYASAGADVVDAGTGSDEVYLTDGTNNFAGDSYDGGVDADVDYLHVHDVANTVNVVFANADGGTISDGTDIATFTNFDFFQLNDATDDAVGIFDARLAGYGVQVHDYGNTTVYGSAFDDYVEQYSPNGVGSYWDLGGGNDLAVGWTDNETILGGAGNDSLYGQLGDDALWGGTGDDLLFGEADADTFIVEDGFGNDTITGGEGTWSGVDFDVIDLTALTTGATVDWTSSEAGTIVSGTDTITFSEIEQIIFTNSADSVDASAETAAINLDGADGNDTLLGGDGADTLVGGDGDDSISGGAGADFLKSGQGQDTLDGGDGADTLMNAAGDDSLVGGTGNDLIVATQGNDTLEGGAGFDTLMGGVDNDSLDGGADDDLLLGDLAGVAFNATGTDGVGLASGITDFPSTQLSYEITFSSTTATSNAVFASYAGASGTNEFLIEESGGQLRLHLGNTSVLTGVPTAPFYDGAVHTLAVTWDSATGVVELYFDGASVYTGTIATGASLDQNGTFALGQEQDAIGGGFDPNQIFQGEIYGVRLYDDVRTPAEILDSTQGPVAETSDPNLIANWVADPNAATFTDTTGSHVMTMSGDVSATWSSGDDRLLGGDGADTLYGGGGNDTLDGGTGNDTTDGGQGSDTFNLSDNFGDDTIVGGEDPDGLDIDVIDASGITTGGVTVTTTNESGSVIQGADSANFSEIESFTLTDQDDTFAAFGTDAVTVNAGGGNDEITEGHGDNTIDGGTGSDTIKIGYGNSTITGGEDVDGSDTDIISAFEANDGISVVFDGTEQGTFTDNSDTDSGTFTQIEGVRGSNQTDFINAAADNSDGLDLVGYGGDDTIIGGSGNDVITGGLGSDIIDGGAGDDILISDENKDIVDGGAGDDFIMGGSGDDQLTGGDGNDEFVYIAGDGIDTITDFNTGNTGTLSDGDNTNNDFIDLSAYYDNIAELQDDYADDGVLNQSNASNTIWGQKVDYSDNTSFAGGGIQFDGQTADGNSFTTENTGVVCFTSGTLVATPNGEVPVETLRPGDLVLTRDNGPQRLVWIGRRHVPFAELAREEKLRPIEIKPHLIKAERPLVVSRQHGVLLKVDGEETLVRAIHLTKLPGAGACIMHGCRGVTYVHLMFEDHQIIFAGGAPSESFHPGPQALDALNPQARSELIDLFSELPKALSRDFAPYSQLRHSSLSVA